MRCAVCGLELRGRRIVDSEGVGQDRLELICRNPNCPEQGKRLEFTLEELIRAEEEQE